MEFTGERYLPSMESASEISVFHFQRYAAALRFCENKKVLDAACGEGYGSAMIAEKAESVIGIDISEEAIGLAQQKYKRPNLSFITGSVADIPVEDDSVDIVVSFETIEHISEDLQLSFMNEIKRVLKTDGMLIMSSPDKKRYSEIPDFHNPFHIHELYFEEFVSLLKRYFAHISVYYQGMFCNSYIYGADNDIFNVNEEILLENEQNEETRAEYIIAVCSNGNEEKPNMESVVYDRVNMYYKMRDEINAQSKYISKLKENIGEPENIIEQKENYINEQREQIHGLEDSLRETNGIVIQKENYICEQREKINSLEARLREADGILNKRSFRTLLKLYRRKW